MAALSLLGASVAQAQTTPSQTTAVNTEGLTEQQVADLAKQAADLRAGQTAQDPKVAVQKVSEYVEIGKGIGAGLGEAARQLNVAVNDFAKTPVGIVTIALIVFKVAGGKIIGVSFGLLWFLITIPTWMIYFNKIGFPKKLTEEFDATSGKRTKRTYTPVTDDNVFGMRMIMLCVVVVICISGFFMLFS
jgi:hypothetical protein